MHIRHELPQFNNAIALLVVTGDRGAEMYRVHNGEVERLDDFTVDVPHYSDNEGFFGSRRGGFRYAGSVREPPKRPLLNDYAHALSKHLHGLMQRQHFDEMYVFVPAYRRALFFRQLPVEMRKKVKGIIEGNFFRYHPFQILDRVAQLKNHPPVRPLSDDALKLLMP